MQLRSTSTQRTYRYVRVSIVGAVAFLAVALGAEIISGGALGSVSAAFYTPARNVFVGSLCAIAVALLALSGRSVEQVLLDIAAVFAPVIALVPVPLTAADTARLGVRCGEGYPCVPAATLPDVANAVLTLAVGGVMAVAAAGVLAVVQRSVRASAVVPIAAAAVVVGAGGAWWSTAPHSFLVAAHDVATVAFFSLIAVVAALAAWRPAGRPRRRRMMQVLYAVIAAGIAATLVFLVVVAGWRGSGASPGFPLFFAGEAVALGLFAAFWVVQTVELWDDDDPALLSVRRE
ncbi:hypothetical protein ACTU3I_16270 [Microbacterium sp. RD1]|uniref:hypothetical protein n=1 Tax=Microbacterium sp. RD1 TaxID=3457313 RepID=UPI003FA5404F